MAANRATAVASWEPWWWANEKAWVLSPFTLYIIWFEVLGQNAQTHTHTHKLMCPLAIKHSNRTWSLFWEWPFSTAILDYHKLTITCREIRTLAAEVHGTLIDILPHQGSGWSSQRERHIMGGVAWSGVCQLLILFWGLCDQQLPDFTRYCSGVSSVGWNRRWYPRFIYANVSAWSIGYPVLGTKKSHKVPLRYFATVRIYSDMIYCIQISWVRLDDDSAGKNWLHKRPTRCLMARLISVENHYYLWQYVYFRGWLQLCTCRL